DPALPLLLDWLPHRGAVPAEWREWLAGGLAALAEDAEAAAALQELHLRLPLARKQATAAGPVRGDVELAVGHGADGLFAAGWLDDPRGLVEGIRAVSPFGTARPLEPLHRFAREDLHPQLPKRRLGEAGFVAYLPGGDPAPAFQHRFELLLRSGARIDLVPPVQPADFAEARAAVLGSVPAPYLRTEMLAGA